MSKASKTLGLTGTVVRDIEIKKEICTDNENNEETAPSASKTLGLTGTVVRDIEIKKEICTDNENNEETAPSAKRLRLREQREPASIKEKRKFFSASEEVTLVDLVDQKKDILNNYNMNAFNWRSKEEAWAELAKHFVRLTGVRREWQQLRDKFLLMKRKARMELEKERECSLRDMGNVTPLVKQISQRIIAMDEDVATEGLKKSLENDRSTYTFDNDPSINSEDDIDVSENLDTNDVTALDDNQSSSSSPKPTYTKPTDIIEKDKMKLILLQQNFCSCENERAQAVHEVDILERKIRADDEARERKLRIELLELEIKQKKEKLNIQCSSS